MYQVSIKVKSVVWTWKSIRQTIVLSKRTRFDFLVFFIIIIYIYFFYKKIHWNCTIKNLTAFNNSENK